jgi:hypothetical protein
MGSEITSFSFWFGFIYFLISTWLAFYIPGSFLLRRISLSTFQRVVLAAIIGGAVHQSTQTVARVGHPLRETRGQLSGDGRPRLDRSLA